MRSLQAFLTLYLMVSSSVAADKEWLFHKTTDGTHPNGDEQQMMWLMNRARQDPAAEGEWLANSTHPDILRGFHQFGVDREILKREFAELQPAPPTAFDSRLYEGMLAHSHYLIELDSIDSDLWHVGQIARAQSSGFQINGGSQSVHPTAENGFLAHVALNVDWGIDENGPDGTGMQSMRSHREGIMGTQWAWTSSGIAFVAADPGNNNLKPNVFSAFYALASPLAENHYNTFLIGTVWTDANANQLYDPGEGIANVRVEPDRGDYYAITGNAGGYAIPVAQSSEVAITFSGVELGESIIHRHVTVGSSSVLVEWNPTPLPTDTDPVDPGPVDPGPVDPGPVDPGPVDPGPVDPGPVDPGPVDPTPHVDPIPGLTTPHSLQVNYAKSSNKLILSWAGEGSFVIEESTTGSEWTTSPTSVSSKTFRVYSASIKQDFGKSNSQTRLYRVRKQLE
jgi:hypothetical protein